MSVSRLAEVHSGEVKVRNGLVTSGQHLYEPQAGTRVAIRARI